MKLLASGSSGFQRVQRWLGDGRGVRLLASVTVIAVRTGIDVLTQSRQRRPDAGGEEEDESEEEEYLAAEVVGVLQSGVLEERLQELRQEVSDAGLELLELTERLHCGRPQLLECSTVVPHAA